MDYHQHFVVLARPSREIEPPWLELIHSFRTRLEHLSVINLPDKLVVVNGRFLRWVHDYSWSGIAIVIQVIIGKLHWFLFQHCYSSSRLMGSRLHHLNILPAIRCSITTFRTRSPRLLPRSEFFIRASPYLLRHYLINVARTLRLLRLYYKSPLSMFGWSEIGLVGMFSVPIAIIGKTVGIVLVSYVRGWLEGGALRFSLTD